jgi:tripartite ATP-independent transporter DctP family solute receptor
MGKALLASLDERGLAAYLAGVTLVPRTPQTIRDPVALRSELSRVRRTGYAVDREEYELGVCCVAAGVRNHNGTVVAAVGLSGPAARMPRDRIVRELGPLVAMNALAISKDLGWVPPSPSLAELEEAVEGVRTLPGTRGRPRPGREEVAAMRNAHARTIAGIAGAAILAGSLGLAGLARAGEVKAFRYGHANAVTYPYHLAGLAFAKDLEQRTKGALKVNVFPLGQLGGERDITEGLQLGTIDFQATSLGVTGTFIKPVNILNLPFIFKGPDHWTKVMHGPLGEWILKEAVSAGEKVNLKVLGIGGAMFRVPMNNVRAITKIDDFKGLKIRTMEVPLHKDTYKAMGASPVPLPFGELYTALQTGVVDGNENGPATLEAMKFYEVQKYVTYLPVVSNGGIFLMSLKTWQRLSPEEQKAVTESAKAWVKSMDDEGLKQDSEALKKMEAKGTKINTIKDMTPYVNATKHIYDQMLKDYPKEYRETVDRILKLE